MTTIEFRFDEQSFAEDLQQDPVNANPAVLAETYFVMLVRFCINGIDLLRIPGREQERFYVHPGQGAERRSYQSEESCWLPLPLLGFATEAVQVLNGLRSGDEQKLYLAGDGHLTFTRQGDQLSIVSNVGDHNVSCQYDEVLQAFLDFSEKARQLLLARIPGMSRHPWWNRWFPSQYKGGQVI